MDKEFLVHILKDQNIHPDIYIIRDQVDRAMVHFKTDSFEFTMVIVNGILWCTSTNWAKFCPLSIDLSTPGADPVAWIKNIIENKEHISQEFQKKLMHE